VTVPREEAWLDGDDGRLVRPYAVSNGRTTPSTGLDLTSLVQSAGGAPPSGLEPDHAQALALCREPASVAAIAERLRLPAAVTKILLADLLEWNAVTAATAVTAAADVAAVTDEALRPDAGPADRDVLERVLDGLQRRL
jgi:Protein of unknown function (DUF742)